LLIITGKSNVAVMKDDRKRPLTTEEKNECRALKALWDGSKKQLGLTQELAAAEMGISQAGVSHYLNARAALNAPSAVHFSKMLNIPVADFSPRLAKQIKSYSQRPDWMRAGSSVQEESSDFIGNSHYRNIPIVSPVWLGKMGDIMDFNAKDCVVGSEIGPADVGEKSFWLAVEDDSMTSRNGPVSVPRGMLILVDPDLAPSPEKLVVARIVSANEATFRKLVKNNGKRYLSPLNDAFLPMMEVTDDIEIIGSVREAKIKF
jgi:SOS-response transcriptional repressor LexA